MEKGDGAVPQGGIVSIHFASNSYMRLCSYERLII
jgi:hypothetical protein